MSNTSDNGIPLPELTHEVSLEDSQQVSEQLAAFIRMVEASEYNLEQLQSFELKLLDAFSLAALIDVLVYESRAQFELDGVQLFLLDPDSRLQADLPAKLDHQGRVIFMDDANEFKVLYGNSPEVERVTEFTAPMADLFSVDRKLRSAVKMPLTQGETVVGSLHWGSSGSDRFDDKRTLEMIGHLAAVIGICIENCLNQERLNKLSLIDPLTRVGNRRMFEIELAKEISRANRSREPVSLISVYPDNYAQLNELHGHSVGEHALRNLSAKVDELLRTTDSLSRYDEHSFVVILPGCAEEKALDVCQRIRHEVTQLPVVVADAVDPGMTASVGLITWFPTQYPAVNMEQLSRQLTTGVKKAVDKARSRGGDSVDIARLTTLLL
ncbi:MAG: two-component system cell cycle response regulator [Halieaceae bacterium]|jgi:two-component system cell cycle response regulator